MLPTVAAVVRDVRHSRSMMNRTKLDLLLLHCVNCCFGTMPSVDDDFELLLQRRASSETNFVFAAYYYYYYYFDHAVLDWVAVFEMYYRY
jgi:hypothetical protein